MAVDRAGTGGAAATIEVVTSRPPEQIAVEEVLGDRGPETVMTLREVTPDQLDTIIVRECRDELLHEIAESLAQHQPHRSPKWGLTRGQRTAPFVAALALAAGLGLAPRVTVIAFFAMATLTLGAVMVFRLSCVLRGVPWLVRRVRGTVPASTGGLRGVRGEAPAVPDHELPLYTILVPVFREANIVGRLIDNLERIDYPRDRLEVLVLLEEDDLPTIQAALAADPPDYMRIVIVPRGTPQTKPRACNYGLVFARGEFLVIYDAEDRPEPDQLRKVVADFRADAVARASRADGDSIRPLAVVQCCLSYFNASYNVLTRLFAIEYSFLFDAMLPGIDGSGLPMPLGGTSNHFDTATLRELGGWDPYNVTEDADLGLRAAALGYRVGVNTSTTWEEACSRSGAFVKQRTRWIKGYLLTSAVNLRHPVAFTRATGLRGLVCLLALVLGTPLAFLAYPVMVLTSLLTLTGWQWTALDLPAWVVQLGLVTTAASTGLTIVVSALVALPRYGWRIAAFAVFSPVYWLLHAVAAWRAAWQAMFQPHVWEKTPHGLSDDLEPESLLG